MITHINNNHNNNNNNDSNKETSRTPAPPPEAPEEAEGRQAAGRGARLRGRGNKILNQHFIGYLSTYIS